MRPRTTWGIVGALAIATTMGVWLGPGAARRASDEGTTPASGANRAGAQVFQTSSKDSELACDDIALALETFLAADHLPRPNSCSTGDASQISLEASIAKPHKQQTFKPDLRFIVATLPDPVHTHLALLFDHLTEVIQDAAQDEGYSYEASWLPWNDQEENHPLLADDDRAANRKELRESQPGIILFRRAAPASVTEQAGQAQASPSVPLGPYFDGLIVFVVGEDPTRGIHTEQFTNALAWIDTLKLWEDTSPARVAILGPSFSGSFPSLAKLLSAGPSRAYLEYIRRTPAGKLAIYTGTANSGEAIAGFGPTARAENLDFHSFLERDEVELERYCEYVKKQSVDPARIAVLSEDETAYGGNGTAACLQPARWFYYPRDISALRAAYQTNSIFDIPGQSSSEAARGRLPTDLADPEGIDHDTIQSYAGNQTPVAEEAYLLGIVNGMRLYHSQYVILRGTNALDQLFLARYLRRAYPDARIVIDGADRLFERERGFAGVGGTMSLSTYPLLATEREWIAGSNSSPGKRSFNSDTSEGTYIAFRLLLHAQALSQYPDDPCALPTDTAQFSLPAVTPDGSLPPLPTGCTPIPPIPDYGMPSQTASKDSGASGCGAFRRPATWLSVLARDGYWAIAAMNEKTIEKNDLESVGEGHHFETPLSLELCLILLAAFICFHFWCCWKASFTAKPAFRTHFASPGEWRHTVLVSLGSLFVGLVPLLIGWGCGLFDPSPATTLHRSWMLGVVSLECIVALAAGVVNIVRVRMLAHANEGFSSKKERRRTRKLIVLGASAAAAGVIVFCVAYAWPLQKSLTPANRFFTYYRGMHVLSGVSPIVPLVLLAIGMYTWFWNSLHGLALFGPDCPKLPDESDLLIPNSNGKPEQLGVLRMFSQQRAADPTERGAKPLATGAVCLWILLCVGLSTIVWTMSRQTPVRSLGAEYYAVIFLVLLIACFSLMLAEAWQLLRTWTKLRELLMFLDRTPLRRTLAALRGFSWGSVWGMSGNVLDVRYKLLSRQIESMRHTRAALNAVAGQKMADADHFRLKAHQCITALAKRKQAEHDHGQAATAEDCLEVLRLLRQSPRGTTRAKLESACSDIIIQALGVDVPDKATTVEVQKTFLALEKFAISESQNASAIEQRCLDALDASQAAGRELDRKSIV
jgi:hypothetical protein